MDKFEGGYYFYKDAVEYGAKEAIVLFYFRDTVLYNREPLKRKSPMTKYGYEREYNCHGCKLIDGIYWCRFSNNDLVRKTRLFSIHQMRRIMINLVTKGALVKGKFGWDYETCGTPYHLADQSSFFSAYDNGLITFPIIRPYVEQPVPADTGLCPDKPLGRKAPLSLVVSGE